MCGIFGTTTVLPRATATRVASSLAHRGPDGGRTWFGPDVTLVHRRLVVIDPAEPATQPMSNEDDTVWVVFNGEIYNHRELRRELVGLGHTFRTSHSDTEVLVHGYEAWGDALVERLDGMFAFGVWDARRKRVLVARDRMGKKPLFYALANGVLSFSSTMEALHVAGHPRELETRALPLYLAYGFVEGPLTLHRGISALPPASRLVFEARRHGASPVVQTYWSPVFGTLGPGYDDSYEDAVVKVRSHLTTAVRRRLDADVPIGAFLSGGLDSTIVVALMAQAMDPRRVHTFSIGFAGESGHDETRYARVAARAFRTEHTEFVLQPNSFELIEELVRHHDGPFGDSSAIPAFVVSKLARRSVTVALTGDGGDEVFCGYTRFMASEIAEYVPPALRPLATRATGALAGLDNRSMLGRAHRFFLASELPLADRMARWNSYFGDPGHLLRPEIRAQIGDAIDLPLRWQRAFFAEARGLTILSRVLEHNFRTYLPFDLLVKADRASMAHGLELRSPFLDRALVEYVSRLPPLYLRRGRLTKRILRDAFRDLVPKPILSRGKMGFAVPLDMWFRGELRPFLHEQLGRNARINAYLEPSAIVSLLAEHEGRRANLGQQLWLLLTLETWLRQMEQAHAFHGADVPTASTA